ncbi:MAG: beta-ketoacyl-ACP synthase III [Anaerovoracaceae bacterium]|jgi:3-oxoacyl-[acyl-carrier-protein] synthase-3
MSFRIMGTGSYVPPHIVTNEDLSKMLDTTDEWITQRVGVKQRHISTEETASEMGAKAGKAALNAAGVAPEELDLIICSTVGGEDASPAVAAMIQHYLGATCPAFDLNAACAGFIYGLETAAGFFALKKYKKILIVSSEMLSRFVDWDDRGTAVIFADGAGAVVLEEGDNYLSSVLTATGGDKVIKIPNFMGKSPFYKKEQAPPYIFMDGGETFKFAVSSSSRDLIKVIREAGLKEEDIDHVLFHQANIRIIDKAKSRLNIPPERFYSNIAHIGNTSSASIPIALDELARMGRLKEGDYIAMSGFGGGLVTGACIIRW